MTRHPDSMTHVRSGSVMDTHSNVMTNPPHSVFMGSYHDFCGEDLFGVTIPDGTHDSFQLEVVIQS